MKSKLINELNNIKHKLTKWGYHYYVLDKPIVADQVYDATLARLLAIEKQYPHLKTSDSPSQRVGGKILPFLTKVTHQRAMLSLANAFSFDDLKKFDNDIKKVTKLSKIAYMVELKIDGLAISIVYQNGKLKYAATRGDGLVGEDVTEKITKIYSIPLQVNNNLANFEIRGEIYLSKNDFYKINQEIKQRNTKTEQINKQRQKEKEQFVKLGKNNQASKIKALKLEKLFANPRNAAAGSVRVLDSNISKSRNLQAFLYFVSHQEELNIKTQHQVLEYLKLNQAQVNKYNKLCLSIEDVIKEIENVIKNKNNYPYEIDGVVVKVNDLSLYPIIGQTTKFPKWSIAYKLPTPKVETKIVDIFATIGRTGKITYNAQLEPVKIMGTTVSFATLHNADFIQEKDIRIGDFVVVNKAGDIIPEVIKVIKEKRTAGLFLWKEEQSCPSCKSVLQKIPPEVNQFCFNDKCDERIIKNLVHFASRGGMEILGLGHKIIKRFYHLNIIKSIEDIYLFKTRKEKIISLKNFKKKSFDNLVLEIEKAKNLGLDRLLFALGIRHIGSKSAQVIAKHFTNFDKILAISNQEEISKIFEIGDKIANSLFVWKSQPQNIALVNFLKKQGQNISFQPVVYKKSLITNKTLVFTGSLSRPRKYYQKLIKLYGGTLNSTISSKTNFLVVGKNPGSKLEQAKKLHVRIIEEKFLTSLEKE